MVVKIFATKISNFLTKIFDFSSQKSATSIVKNDFVKSPQKDCFIPQIIDVQKYRKQKNIYLNEFNKYNGDNRLSFEAIEEIFNSAGSLNQLKIKLDLYNALTKIKNNKGRSKLIPYEIKLLLDNVSSLNEAKYAEELINLKDKNGQQIMEGFGVHEILLSIKKNPKFAKTKINLAKNLANIKSKENKGLESYEISKITAITNTDEEAQAKFDFAKRIVNLQTNNGHFLAGNVNLGELIAPIKTIHDAKQQEKNLLRKLRKNNFEGIIIINYDIVVTNPKDTLH